VAESVQIGRLVRAFRKAAGLSQQALAVAAGLSLAVVAQIEQGRKADPRLSTALALARALGVRVEDLVGGEPKGRAGGPRRRSGRAR
jgi:transcriptional regulator with XRE-family HTH domain